MEENHYKINVIKCTITEIIIKKLNKYIIFLNDSIKFVLIIINSENIELNTTNYYWIIS